MAHESFEDSFVAEILNKHFVPIKVDKEQRPDIDSIYMNVCQAFTGSGGWPMSIFITPDQMPFFAGTYFTKDVFVDLLSKVNEVFITKRDKIAKAGKEVIASLSKSLTAGEEITDSLIETAFIQLTQSFDDEYGGFGTAPKFPTPHNLIFLMDYYKQTDDKKALQMVEKTLLQMYKGGIFDHVGFGFSRYSTDRIFLVPHFEKMLYDNALLIISYIKAFDITKKDIYKEIAVKTATYLMSEMMSVDGSFFSAQDADSDGVEGKYYVFDYDEILGLLGNESGRKFNDYYGVTINGNFEGKNILNLLQNNEFDDSLSHLLPKIYEYRKTRTSLHLDDKILTSWNSLLIAAFALMYRVLGDEIYINAAKRACQFIDEKLSDGETLFVSIRDNKTSSKGFLDEYAYYIYALLNMYEACLDNKYLQRAYELCKKAINDFYDSENGGFYLSGIENERLIIRPKETYDGAMPSGNSVMAYNLVKLSRIDYEKYFEDMAKKQLRFMSSSAEDYPMGYCFFLYALSLFFNPREHIVCALHGTSEKLPLDADIKIIPGGNDEYPLINGSTTYYVCKEKICLAPVNKIEDALLEDVKC